MKKRSLLAIFMVVVLCFSMMLAGCKEEEKSSKKKSDSVTETVEKLTAGTAMSNTLDALCTMDHAVPVLEDMSEKKVITASVDGLISNVLNLDAKNLAFYDELSVTVEGETVTGHIYCDGTELAVTSTDLFGPGVAVGINFSTLLEDLETSGLLDLLESEMGAELADLEEALTQYAASAEEMNATTEKVVAALEEFTQGIEYTEAEGTANVYGAQVGAVIYTYTMDKDDYKKLMDLFLDLAEESYRAEIGKMIAQGYMTADEAEDMNLFAEARDEMNAAWDDVDMSGVLKLYANPDNGCLMLIECTFIGTVEGETMDANMTLTLGEDPATSEKYVLAMDMNLDDTEILTMELALTSTTNGSVDTTTLDFDATVEGEEMDLLNFTATYDNSTSAYELAVEADGEKIAARGYMESTDDYFSITVDSLEADGETLELGFSLSIENDPNCEIPSVPEYANVLTDLGLADLLEERLYSYDDSDDYYDYDDIYTYDYDDIYTYDYDDMYSYEAYEY